MTRARDDELRASTFQYQPPCLLYRTDSHWHLGDLLTVQRRIRDILPPELRQGWKHICEATCRDEDEGPAILTAQWINRHGEQHGFRTPRIGERARTIGSTHYQRQLNLTPRQLFDAQGNHFDPAAIMVRLFGTIRAWVSGQRPPAHSYPSPAEIHESYKRLKARLRSHDERIPTEDNPFPGDIIRSFGLSP